VSSSAGRQIRRGLFVTFEQLIETVCGLRMLNDGRYAVLADRTTIGSPAQWGEAVVKWSNAMTTSMLTTSYSKSISAAKWRLKW
jgi:hypothetical protein